MSELVSPAEQVTRVATLLGRAVLRWKREKEQSSEISEIVSGSLPERLEYSPVSSLSVTGQNDEATGLEETSSDSEINPNNHVRGATNKDRDLDRRSDLAKREQDGRAAGCRIQRADHATKRRNDVQRQKGPTMSLDTKVKLAELSELSIGQLAAKYEKLFGEKCRSRNRRYVYRRVAWKIQADDEGGLSERAILRATVIAGESLLRVTPPNARKSKREVPASIPADWDPRIPPPGQVIERHYKGKLLIVMVMTDCFEFEGERYKSLTAVARAITGSHCNGFHFFKLGQSK